MTTELKPPKWWMIPIQWVVVVLWQFIWLWLGDLLGYVMVPLAIWLGWDTKVFGVRIFWPWDAYPNPKTGTYYDYWYSNPKSPTHTKISLWAWNKGGFWREYYWRVRNSFSNGGRYMIKNAPWVTDPVTGAMTHPTVYEHTYEDGGYYRYDTKRWWLAQHRRPVKWFWFWEDEYYWGWKFDRHEGFGSTHRGWPAVLCNLVLTAATVWGIVTIW